MIRSNSCAWRCKFLLPAAALTDGGTVINDPGSLSRSLPGRTIGSSDAAPIRQVGRYQVIGKLGEGAMASVYKAYDPSIDRSLVIKFLHPELCRDAETRNRFLREAKAAGVLSHPNIVTVFDVGEIEGIFHTHAHDDHFAGLPALLASGRRLKYFTTPLVRHSVTRKLSALLSIDEAATRVRVLPLR